MNKNPTYNEGAQSPNDQNCFRTTGSPTSSEGGGSILNVPEEIKEKTASFMLAVENPENTFKSDTEINGVKVKYVVFYKFGRTPYNAISYKTYEQYRDYIDTELSKALQKREFNRLANTFEVLALTGDFYSILKNRLIPRELFNKLYSSGDLFFCNADCVADYDGHAHEGWNLSKAGQQKIIEYAKEHITEEQQRVVETILAQRTKAEEEKKKALQLAKEILKKCAFLDEVEHTQAQPIPETINSREKYQPRGEKIQDPRNPENIYGGGHWWVIESNRIIAVHNNGADDDDWSLNNIKTAGAGAIGFVIPKSPEVLEALEFIKNNRVDRWILELAEEGVKA